MHPFDEDIRIVRKWFSRRYQEWEAEGVVTVWGADVRWRAFLPRAGGFWEIEVPGGQDVHVETVDRVIDMFDVIRARLTGDAQSSGVVAA